LGAATKVQLAGNKINLYHQLPYTQLEAVWIFVQNEFLIM